MQRQSVTIDEEKCTSCGQCVDICLAQVLRENGGVIEVVQPELCNLCGHCVAVCPAGAARAGDDEPLVLAEKRPVAPAELMGLIRARRSTRAYTRDPVPRELVRQVVEAARFAPTGANMQSMHYTVVEDPETLGALRDRVIANLDGRVREWEALAEAHERQGAPIPEELKIRVENRHSYRQMVETARGGRDVIFYGAPAVILLHSDPTGVTPKDDANLMAMCMLLMAESLGLGTCLLGLLNATLAADASSRALVGLPEGHQVHATTLLGHPAVAFTNAPGRRTARIRWL